MRLTRIVIHGFKSFADRVELALEPGLTGVVGPNGCGKSNIVDALRWVSGEASARGVRGDDMDDVIFAGAGNRSARELADVMVVIEGDLTDYARHATDGIAEVRRTITRGHGSNFRIAGREVRARDVQRLFQDAGAGARGTAIVAQGQVQAVIEAKPEDRRRFLEEAAGVGGLQSRKREAESKLLQTEGNLARIAGLIVSLQTRVEQLTRQAAQAERYRKLARELRDAEAALALARLLSARQRQDEAAAAARAADAVAGQADQAYRVAKSAAEAAEAAAIAAQVQLNRLVPRHAALAERVAARRSEAEAARAGAQELAERRDAALRARSEAEEQAASAAAEHNFLQAEDEAAASTESRRSADLPRLEAAAANGTGELTTAEGAALKAREARFAQEADVARIRERRDRLAADLARVEAELAATSLRLAGLVPPEQDQRAAELRHALATLEADLAAAEAGQPDALARVAAAETALVRLLAERDAVAQALPGLERRRTELVEQQQRLERRQAALSERRRVVDRQRKDLADAEGKLGLRPAQGVQATAGQLGQARDRLQAGEATLADARARLSEAEADRAARLAAATAAATGLARHEAERRELVALLPPIRADEVMAAIDVAEDLAAPLAAALGEGLSASLDDAAPRHWRRHKADPDLPVVSELSHLPRLADLVQVPGPLAGALAPVWLVEAASAPALQPYLPPGGALVSADGGLWRWDGYVRRPGAPDAAALLLAQRDRLRRLDATIEAERPVLATCEAERSAAEQNVVQARRHVAESESLVGLARADLQAAERAAADALAKDEAWGRRQAELAAAAVRLSSAEEALAADQTELDTEKAVLPDLDTIGSELSAIRSRRAELSAAVGQAERERDAANQGASGLAARIGRLRQQIGEMAIRAREAEASFQAARTRIVAEHAAAEADAARHAQDRARLVEQADDCAAELERATATLEDVRLQAATAEKALAQAREEAGRTERAFAQATAELQLLRERSTHRAERRSRLDTEQERIGAAIAEAARRAAELGARADLAAGSADRLAGEAGALVEAELAEAAAVTAARAASHEADTVLKRRRDALAATEQAEREAALRAAEARSAHQAAQAALAALKEELTERFADSPLPEPDRNMVQAPIVELEERVRRLRTGRDRLGAVNLLAAEEAVAAREDLDQLVAEKTELEEAAGRLIKAVRSLDSEARQRLLDQFAVVERHFEELFTRLFNGGTARIRLTDPADPLKGGLELEASPPGKKLTSLSLMSGGEKALTALCLIFAFFLAHPSPLCVLDEVDAPLDDANVGRLVDLVQEIASRTGTRFLVVTHHPLTMARMDRLYGVTMVERGVSRLVSVELGRALEMRRTA
ncbi:MAG TPA: AAA family ATPase [Geminicoccus sp.]|uniref:AAA family ATPase n=1 Tax=Geminicoccus sp. TaxID=2024832 RepID=UPI002E3641A5|nr:AAA family ATPase [Geminicoccus sp.]HEX2524969.1 AAA family ATPase [Geminicoccus sp.]